MSVSRLATALGIGMARLNEIVLGKRGITADTALRLARCFGTSAEFWLNLQSLYDLRIGRTQGGRQNSTHGKAAQGRLKRRHASGARSDARHKSGDYRNATPADGLQHAYSYPRCSEKSPMSLERLILL